MLLLDNYDSFTWNLAQALGTMGCEPRVVRNDQITIAEALDPVPAGIVISPGPGTPAEAGISVALIREAAARGIPLLGVCLGHQAIGEAFGGRVVRASRQLHGKTTTVAVNDEELFSGLPNAIEVMRYHSLILDPSTLPSALGVTAWSTDRPKGEEIMAVRHLTAPIWGVQFHPESVGTPTGNAILANFVQLARRAS